jgi:hypothetical protein
MVATKYKGSFSVIRCLERSSPDGCEKDTPIGNSNTSMDWVRHFVRPESIAWRRGTFDWKSHVIPINTQVFNLDL